MAAFVRVSAVLVGMANVFLVNLVGEGELGNALMWNLDPWWPHNALCALCAAVAGLVVSSIFLRFAWRELRGTFFARYGVMVLAVCLGGVVLGLFLSYTDVLLYSSPLTTAERLLEVTSRLPFTVVAGGVLGAAEGCSWPFRWRRCSVAWGPRANLSWSTPAAPRRRPRRCPPPGLPR